MTSLEELHIHQTELENLPDEIFELPKLRLLCVHGNKLKYINPKISKLKNLRAINLMHNAFHEFPKELLELVNLETLNLDDNYLNSLPTEITQLNKLKRLHFTRNKFKIPKEILNSRPKELIQYILDYQNAKNRRALLEAKLIFIGSGGVGKSSLIKRLTPNK
ncbi:MAG: hypothetical protein IPL95_03100 [Saprospiraceae bacterium]|nr:hypothetical protein [Saprospiraceae bacterium]